MNLKIRFLALFGAVALLMLGGCGGDPTESTPSSDAGSSTTTAAAGSTTGAADGTTASVSASDGTTASSATAQKPTTAPQGPQGMQFDYSILPGCESVVLPETADAGKEYQDKIIFVGDSITSGFALYGALSDGTKTKQVWYGSGAGGCFMLSKQAFATILYPEDGSKLTIKQAAEKSQPEYMVLALGVDDLSFISEKTFKSSYTELINSIRAVSPNTKIMVQSILCVAKSYGKPENINNNKVSKANHWLQEVARDTGVKYLNTISAIHDEQGYLPESLNSGDGLHVKKAAYTKMLEYIRTHAYPD